MDFMKIRVKFVEGFKDGNILEGREFKPGEIAVLSQVEVQKIEQSGGVLEVMENVIPNPLKKTTEGEASDTTDADLKYGKNAEAERESEKGVAKTKGSKSK